MKIRRDDHDRGFTLVELLVVIVVLGILASITVFAVRGITDRGQKSSCADDEKVITTAMEAQMAAHGTYADEATLQANGFLHDESTLHDVTVSPTGDDYTVVGRGACAAVAPATTVPAATTVAPPPSAPVSFPTTVYGNGTTGTLLVFGYGAANDQTHAMMESYLADNAPLLSIYTVVWVDTGGRTLIKIDELQQILGSASFDEVFFHRGYDDRTVYSADGVTPYTGTAISMHTYMTNTYGTAAHDLRWNGFFILP